MDEYPNNRLLASSFMSLCIERAVRMLGSRVYSFRHIRMFLGESCAWRSPKRGHRRSGDVPRVPDLRIFQILHASVVSSVHRTGPVFLRSIQERQEREHSITAARIFPFHGERCKYRLVRRPSLGQRGVFLANKKNYPRNFF